MLILATAFRQTTISFGKAAYQGYHARWHGKAAYQLKRVNSIHHPKVIVYPWEYCSKLGTWFNKMPSVESYKGTERMMVRCGVSLKDRKCSVDLYSLLGVQSVDEVVKRGRLRWFGHVERKSGD